MTNEELKKKIIEIVLEAKITGVKIREVCGGTTTASEIADALIAAGIGDDSELEVKCEVLQRDVDNLTRTMEEGREELEEAEHRTKVFEKALDLCETAYLLAINHKAFEGISLQAMASDFGIHRFFIEQAEKELAKGTDND